MSNVSGLAQDQLVSLASFTSYYTSTSRLSIDS